MIRTGIAGYGNLGRGVELAIRRNPDMKLAGFFTRRPPETLKTLDPSVPVWRLDDAENHVNDIDVLIICGGSATDLPVMTPRLARLYNVVDSFDTHAHVPDHFSKVDAAASETGHVALISCGWDPGMFSLARLYSMCILPDEDHPESYTFWGPGVSQGHSDAVRRIPGVIDARQYTVPVEAAVEAVKRGDHPVLTAREKHLRVCYVAVEDGADKALIEKKIKEMPDYFADYDTTVHFIPLAELKEKHGGLPHGGSVIRSGKTGRDFEHTQTVEFKLTLDSNPEFTAGVLCAFARAVAKLSLRGDRGCKTVFDIAPADLSPLPGDALREHFL